MLMATPLQKRGSRDPATSNSLLPSSAVRMLREELQLLQEPGSYVGEVVKVCSNHRVEHGSVPHSRCQLQLALRLTSFSLSPPGLFRS